MIFKALLGQCIFLIEKHDDKDTWFLPEKIHISQFHDAGLVPTNNIYDNSFLSVWRSTFETADGKEVYGSKFRTGVMKSLKKHLTECGYYFVDRSIVVDKVVYFEKDGVEMKTTKPFYFQNTTISMNPIDDIHISDVDTDFINFEFEGVKFASKAYNIPKSSLSKKTVKTEPATSGNSFLHLDDMSSDSDDTDNEETTEETAKETDEETTKETVKETTDDTTSDDTTASATSYADVAKKSATSPSTED